MLGFRIIWYHHEYLLVDKKEYPRPRAAETLNSDQPRSYTPTKESLFRAMGIPRAIPLWV